MSRYRATLTFIAACSIFAAHSSHAASAGTVSFSSAAGFTFQNATIYNFPVARVGGSSGAAGAVCTAISGTAVLGKDFKMANSSLQWASGNASTINCGVAVFDTTPFTGEKTFTLELTSVSGASLGGTARETVSIHGNKGCGSLEFSTSSFSVAQNAGTVQVTVNRTGGSAKGAYVFYSTANGTASAGTNYSAKWGSLSWVEGDSSPKTITLQISNAVPFLGTKTFAIALASPQDAVLGAQPSAIVTIDGDATSSANTASLTWSAPTKNTNGAPVTALAGYRIAYGASESALTKVVVVSGAKTTSYEIAGLPKGTWYFKVAADAGNGVQGPYSTIGSKAIN